MLRVVLVVIVVNQLLLAWIQCDSVEVVIANGTVIGERIVEQDVEVDLFLGIPYAKPPVGKLRFRRPLPPDSWSSPLNATKFPDDCAQSNYSTNEDCLYLNIWSPVKKAINETELKPVLVWIHGGSLLKGGSSFFYYNAGTLAVMADCVVVTFNYRLATLGFFYSDQVDDVKGNQGFWDQNLALQWITENIRPFGGDPKKITIAGWSAGSWSVSTLILSPVSRNLFQNAIMMSGGNVFGVVEENPTVIVNKLLVGIREVGCATDNHTTISASVVQCLEGLKAEKIINIYYSSIEKRALPKTIYDSIAVVDGYFIPDAPHRMLASGNHKKNFSLLLSTVENEGILVLSSWTRDPRLRMRDQPESISLLEAKKFLYQLASDAFPKHQLSNETLNRIYFNGIDAQHDNPNLFRKKLGVAFGDYLITCPTVEFGKRLYGSDAQSIQVFQWYYTARVSDRSALRCAPWAGVCHTDDLMPFFGWPFQLAKHYTNRERDISREVINFVRSFIRNGSPGEDQREWQSYFLNSDNRTVVAPYYHLGYQPKSHHSFKLDLKHAECNLWNTYYYD